MTIKRKIKIELNIKEEALVHYEMEWEKNDSIIAILLSNRTLRIAKNIMNSII